MEGLRPYCKLMLMGLPPWCTYCVGLGRPPCPRQPGGLSDQQEEWKTCTTHPHTSFPSRLSTSLLLQTPRGKPRPHMRSARQRRDACCKLSRNEAKSLFLTCQNAHGCGASCCWPQLSSMP